MQKEIKYTEFTETPSDYVCPDGDLATVVGMVPEDGALKPIQQPTTLFSLPEGYTVAFIHKNTGYTNYIIREDWGRYKTYYWISSFEPQQVFVPEDFGLHNMIYNFQDSLQDQVVYEINALGNTLIMLVDNGVHYFLFKENRYRFLGTQMPETHLSFGLDSEIVDGDETEFKIEREIAKKEYLCKPKFTGNKYIWNDDLTNRLFQDANIFGDDSFKKAVTDGIAAAVNKFIASESTEKGKFMFPFFVRYAYRLYDESHYIASPPILMLANTGEWSPRVYIIDRYFNGDGGDYDVIPNTDPALFAVPVFLKVKPRGIVFDLNYQAVTIPPELQDWKDIITDIDIFVSAPIYTYNQAGKVEGFQNYISGFQNGYFIGSDPLEHESNFARRTINSYKPDWESSRFVHDHCEFIVPHFSDEHINYEIKSTRDFYLLKSIPINKLQTSRTKLEIDDDYLQSLTNRERLSDDYLSHDGIIAQHSFSYNQRFNITGLSRILSPSMPPKAIATFSNKNVTKYNIYVVINEGGKEITVKSLDADVVSYLQHGHPFVYFFYPNINATKAIIKRNQSEFYDHDLFYELPLTQHEFLNGAVYFNGWNNENLEPRPSESQTEPIPSDDRTAVMADKLYVSEVGNPFVFLSRGIMTVGTGTIIGIRPIVKAMSLAQYGEYDFYVFSTDGVWSLKVDSEGYLQHPHLTTPDIVLGNGESITQIDGAILFATDRGIMLISGSDSVCISDSLFSNTPFRPLAISPADDMLPGLRNIAGDRLQQMQLDLFRNFISDCRMIYDYRHQRIIIYSPTHSYAYIYSLKSKKWGMMPSCIQSSPLNYPAALAMVTGEDSSNGLVDYAENNTQDDVIRVQNGLIITRPLKLDLPDILKTVNTVIQRGKFKKGHVKSIIYGSRDLFSWQLVWSSTDHYLRGFSGTPYKYFCLAMICDLEEGEDLLGCSIEFVPRLANQLR